MSNNSATNGGACILIQSDSDGTVESQRFYLALRTVAEMVRDRGYAPDSEIPTTLAAFRGLLGYIPQADQLRFLAHRLSNPSRKILVIFCGHFEIRKANMVGILSQIVEKESLDRVILILQGGINSHAQKLVDQYQVKVETFKITDLLVNITKHVLIPKYEFLCPEEKQMLFKKFSIQDKQLPKMLEDDAIARYYGLEKGQVVKVSYAEDITGTLVAYRCVV